MKSKIFNWLSNHSLHWLKNYHLNNQQFVDAGEQLLEEFMTSVFISYARADDEPFVERLHHDLIAAGIAVWWDRRAMQSRGRTFLQEIRKAIEKCGRLVAVIGPQAVNSEYVRYEWEHGLLFAKGVVPILRLGDYGLVPDELMPENDQGLAASSFAKLHCPDFREERLYKASLKELVRIIRQPLPKLGALNSTPKLPPHFLPRRDEIKKLQENVLADVYRPTVITPAQQTSALQGMGGIGKSVLAAAFARTISVRMAFEDGVVWLTVGQDADKATLLANIRKIGLAFRDDPAHYASEVLALTRLPEILSNKVCLIVLDDVWSIDQVERFRSALGPRCRLLLTTRDGTLVTALGAQEQPVDLLSDDQAFALLADWSGQEPAALRLEARSVIEECGNLPLALALCGAMARKGMSWADLSEALKAADLTFIEPAQRLPDYPYRNIFRALKVSLDVLARENLETPQRYHELAVFPNNTSIPEPAVITLWGPLDQAAERQAQKLLTLFDCNALLRLEGEAPSRRVFFHPLQRHYLRMVSADRAGSLHAQLIDAYRRNCDGGWPSGPNDGYFFQFLPYHLKQASRSEELRRLLLNYDWLATKLRATSLPSLVEDYLLLPNDTDLTLVQQALLLAAPVLSRAPEQLCSQLWSRLRFIERQELRNLLEQAANCQGQPWLATLTPSLECAGGPLLQTLVGHTDTVNAVAVTPDGQRVISASSDKTLKIWALSTGQLQHTLEGHKGPVSAVAVTPDSRFAISGSTDGTIVIWDISSGSFVRELTGHPLAIRDVAVPLKGGRAISICDKELQVWQIPSGHLLHKFDIAAKYREENCRAEHALLAINSNGKRALTAISFSSLINGSPINSIIEFFDTDVGKLLFSQQAHPCRVNGIAISADGRWGVTAPQSGPYWLSDAYIKVWDLDEGTIKWKLPNGGTRAIALTPDARFLVSSEGIDKWGRRLNSPLMGYPNRISSDVSWRTLDEG